MKVDVPREKELNLIHTKCIKLGMGEYWGIVLTF